MGDGRFAHFRLYVDPRPVDVICGYGYIDHSAAARQTQRHAWWDLRRKKLQAVPRRNGVILMGDFNRQLSQLPNRSVTLQFHFHDAVC